jgi:major intracellular serine protease
LFNTEAIEIFSELNNVSDKLDLYYKDLLNLNHLYNNNILGEGLVCAVLDSGCDTDHYLLRDKIIGGQNFTNEGDCNNFSDYHGHGTHVAGLISSNSDGPFKGGIAPEAKLLICKVLSSQGYGDTNSVINGLNYAIDNKVNVINMSLGTTFNSPELYNTVKKAHENGIIICCASGNMAKGDNGAYDEFCYPGAYQEVIEVGSINNKRQPSYFSNSNNMVDCVCYGEQILSTFIKNQFAVMDGTSQATPLVSGCILLLQQWFINEFGRKPSKDEIYATLIKCSTTMEGFDRKQTGFGYIDLGKL